MANGFKLPALTSDTTQFQHSSVSKQEVEITSHESDAKNSTGAFQRKMTEAVDWKDGNNAKRSISTYAALPRHLVSHSAFKQRACSHNAMSCLQPTAEEDSSRVSELCTCGSDPKYQVIDSTGENKMGSVIDVVYKEIFIELGKVSIPRVTELLVELKDWLLQEVKRKKENQEPQLGSHRVSELFGGMKSWLLQDGKAKKEMSEPVLGCPSLWEENLLKTSNLKGGFGKIDKGSLKHTRNAMNTTSVSLAKRVYKGSKGVVTKLCDKQNLKEKRMPSEPQKPPIRHDFTSPTTMRKDDGCRLPSAECTKCNRYLSPNYASVNKEEVGEYPPAYYKVPMFEFTDSDSQEWSPKGEQSSVIMMDFCDCRTRLWVSSDEGKERRSQGSKNWESGRYARASEANTPSYPSRTYLQCQSRRGPATT